MNPDQTPEPSLEAERAKPILEDALDYLNQMKGLEHNSAEEHQTTAKFVDSLFPAEGDAVLSSIGPLDKDALLEQFKNYFDAQDALVNEREQHPLRHLPRTNGLREAVGAIMNDPHSKQLFRAQLLLEIEQMEARKVAAGELRSEENLDEVGDAALGAAGVHEPNELDVMEAARGASQAMLSVSEAALENNSGLSIESRIEKLVEGLSSADKQLLYEHAVSVFAVWRAEYNREYDNVSHWKREKHATYEKMTDAAKSIAAEYVKLVNSKNS